MTLDSIIERLEKAEGPDREIDRLIHFHVVSPWLAEKCVKWVFAAFEEPNDFLWWTAERKAEGKEGYHDGWLSYTASADAAIELGKNVLPGWRLQIEINHQEPSRAVVWSNDYKQRESVIGPDGKSDYGPAIALCLAILKAKQMGVGE